MKTPKQIRRSDGKMLRFAGYKIPEPFAKSDAQDIAETLEKIMSHRNLDAQDFNNHYYLYDDDDDDSCIEMN